MVIMDNYYTQNRLPEIWRNIDKLHYSYLDMEESPEKIEVRSKLEDCIREYLCIASHNQKFCLSVTAEVLQRSASNKKDFSGYRASTGWNSIQLYAGNLLSQPWRKEYHQIKTFSGFYKHHIEANLVGAEIMFEAMGYKHSGVGVMVLDQPICPDRVMDVSKDCLIAYVECQILKAIWEEVSPAYPITWLDILEFRKVHLCSPEQAVKALKYGFQLKQYNEQNRSFPPTTEAYTRHMNSAPCMHPHFPMNNSFPPLGGHHQPMLSPPQYMYGTNGCCANGFSNYAQIGCTPHIPPLPYVQPPVIKPQFNTNGYYYANDYVPPPMYSYPVPTAQLIELDSHNGYDVVDKPTKYHHRGKSNIISSEEKESERDESQFEDWDYVYRTLENKGYSKDLGERGDVLATAEKKPEPKRKDDTKRSIKLDEGITALKVSDRPLKMTEASELMNAKDRRKSERKPSSRSSSYENLAPADKNPTKSGTLKVKANPNRVKAEEVETKEKWECKACTFLNDLKRDICEICSKTRTNVEKPMEVGGPQCSKCTLVNPRDAKTCQACNGSLKNSPTYI